MVLQQSADAPHLCCACAQWSARRGPAGGRPERAAVQLRVLSGIWWVPAPTVCSCCPSSSC